MLELLQGLTTFKDRTLKRHVVKETQQYFTLKEDDIKQHKAEPQMFYDYIAFFNYSKLPGEGENSSVLNALKS